MTITRSQAEALATFVNRIRDDWDHPGIVAAIGKASSLGSPLDIAHALLTLAENRDLTSPGLLPQQGKHWKRADGTQTGPNVSHNVRCPEHPLNVHPCSQCKAEKDAKPGEDYWAAKAQLAARQRVPTEQKRLTDFAAAKEAQS